MQELHQVYIDGRFVTPHGTELSPITNPATGELIAQVRLADEVDAHAAVAAAKRAFADFSRTGKGERIALLRRLGEVFGKRAGELAEAMINEYGGPRSFVERSMPLAAHAFSSAADALESYEFTRPGGRSVVTMQPIGVTAIITPWNYSVAFVATKVASAIAAGCTTVVKPSELSAQQTQLMTECFDEAGVPAGVVNIVTGRGSVIGDVLTTHPDVAKVNFTGSTAVGQTIMRNAAPTMKRLTLELGGKGPSILLEDADLDTAVPAALAVGFSNNGQACYAGTRILAPASRLAEVHAAIEAIVPTLKVGDPNDPDTVIGPLISGTQFERVQSYIRLGQEEGGQILVGGEGRPAGLEAGWFVQPTVFTGVTNNMRIAQEEIFGPVLCVIAYQDEAEAIEVANDTVYGLRAYVFSADTERARSVAGQLVAGQVMINGAPGDPNAPFGGFKQSGIGRENGVYGLEAHLEPRAVFG